MSPRTARDWQSTGTPLPRPEQGGRSLFLARFIIHNLYFRILTRHVGGRLERILSILEDELVSLGFFCCLRISLHGRGKGFEFRLPAVASRHHLFQPLVEVLAIVLGHRTALVLI